MHWPSEVFSSFPGKSGHESGELWGGEMVIHKGEMQ